MASLSIPVILGTGRSGRWSDKPAAFVLGEVKQRPEVETELIDVRDFAQPVTKRQQDGAQQDALQEKIARADGYIIVSPEYNRSYPGELKMLLDTFEPEYARKPVAICGVSSGASGGGRMVELLRISLIHLRMVPLPDAVLFASVEELFDEAGAIRDTSYHKRVQRMLDELVWFGTVLREARATRSSG